MEPENDCVIDIEAEQIDTSDCESIECWYSAAQVQRILNLNKSGLQKVIAKLTSIYSIDIKILRRGGARATEYSQIALDAIELLNAQKFAELRALVDREPTTAATETAIVFVEQHNQIATAAASAADSNLSKISSLKSGLLNTYRELGRSLGRQAAAEVRQGFTDEVKAGLENLQES
ncbi:MULTISPECIES: hypothetical protein [unclassified Microcoleus]|uniref:hypothetical protein n=1 Tax=unclassified Microcoleus TaxID=2642155 RepID=UPI002FCEE280